MQQAEQGLTTNCGRRGGEERNGRGIISGHKIPHINTKISIYPDWKIFQISHFDKFGELRAASNFGILEIYQGVHIMLYVKICHV